jgi:hypothetical protein
LAVTQDERDSDALSVMPVLQSRTMLWFSLVVALSALSLSCGGSKPDDEVKLREPIAESQAERLLEEVSLSKSDLPEGFVIVRSTFTTNEEAAQHQFLDTRDQALARFERNGRLLSLDAEYHPENLASRLSSSSPSLVALDVSITLYATSAGGAEAYGFGEDQKDRWRAAFTAALANSPQFSSVRSVDSPGVDIGDESFSFGFAGDAQVESAKVPLVYDFIAFRQGPFLVTVLAGGTHESRALEARGIAGRLDQLIGDKLDELTS